MADKFLDYIANKRAKALKQKQRLDDYLVELDRTEKHYRASGAFMPANPEAESAREQSGSIWSQPESLSKAMEAAIERHEATIKDRVVAILRANPQGLTSAQIVEKLQKSGPDIPRTSLSPQLSRLRAAKRVELLDGVWRAAEIVEAEDEDEKSIFGP